MTSSTPWPKNSPDMAAIVHVGPDNVRREYPMKWLQEASCKLANALKAEGIGKGDRVMLILYRRVEFWVAMLALHRMGAVAVPSPNLLTPKDIVYRVTSGKIKAVIAEDSVADRVQQAREECPDLNCLIQAGPAPLLTGWKSYETLMALASPGLPPHRGHGRGRRHPAHLLHLRHHRPPEDG